jgi:hypothetical protein
MIARLRFLEADCRYHTAICDPVAKSVALNIRHSEERAEIMQRLAKTVPDRLTRWSFSTSPRSGTQKTPDARSGAASVAFLNAWFGFQHGMQCRFEHFGCEWLF